MTAMTAMDFEKFFAAGADLKEMAAMGPIGLWADVRPRHWKRIAAFPKPRLACDRALTTAFTLTKEITR